MSHSDSRPGPTSRLWFPLDYSDPVSSHHLPGLPGSSTVLSLRAVSNHPGRLSKCLLVYSLPMTNVVTLGQTGYLLRFMSRGRICFACTTAHRSAFPVSTDEDYSIPLRFSYTYERAISIVHSFQFTISARLILVFPSTQKITDQLFVSW